MKIKYFVLLAMCSALCALGCACKGQPDGSDASDALPPTSESVEGETGGVPVLSVNQSSVTICVGESFTLVAGADNISAPVWEWSIDGNAEEGVVSLAQTGDTAVITALKTGKTKVVVCLVQGEHTYFKTVEVTVGEGSDVNLVVSENIGFNDGGYYVRLSTLSTENGDKTSILPIVTAYKNNKTVAMENFAWTSENTDIVRIDGNKFLSVSEGETSVIGSCEVEGKSYSVKISAEVYRPTIALQESFTVEVENLSKLIVTSKIKGLARDVSYNGVSVGSIDTQSGVLTLSKNALPKASAQMGENRPFVIETSLASYTVNVNLYTKILKTKEDFDSMPAYAKAANPDPAIWDGYFVLGEDIAYNGQFVSLIADLDSLWAAVEGNWSNGGLYGFKGVFDGKGHNIKGISIDKGNQMASIFGVLHIDGVIKNVSFTKARVGANSSLVCHAGGGTIENIYIQYDSIGMGSQHYEGDGSINSHCGSFFSFKEPTATANVSNCVIDITKATINENTSIKAVGSEFVAIKNVFVIGGTDALRKASNATLSYATISDFVEDDNAQNRYDKFDAEFWSKENGIPVFKAVYDEIYGGEMQ